MAAPAFIVHSILHLPLNSSTVEKKNTHKYACFGKRHPWSLSTGELSAGKAQLTDIKDRNTPKCIFEARTKL
jgi:hypothetical protein